MCDPRFSMRLSQMPAMPVAFDFGLVSDLGIRIQSWNGVIYKLGCDLFRVKSTGQIVRKLFSNDSEESLGFCRIDAMMAESVQISCKDLVAITDSHEISKIRNDEHEISLRRIEYHQETEEMLKCMVWNPTKQH